jgi:hypothetical protein
MSSYVRKTKCASVKCAITGCRWGAVYFDKYYSDGREPIPGALRARMALSGHLRRAHAIKAPVRCGVI